VPLCPSVLVKIWQVGPFSDPYLLAPLLSLERLSIRPLSILLTPSPLLYS
jgi:hypothetical protein